MSWINSILQQPFHRFLDSIKADVYEYCDYYREQGGTPQEVHAWALGVYQIDLPDNMLGYLYVKYINDWLEEVDKE